MSALPVPRPTRRPCVKPIPFGTLAVLVVSLAAGAQSAPPSPSTIPPAADAASAEPTGSSAVTPSGEELDRRLRILERRDELAAEAAAEKAKTAVTPTASAKDGFSWKSADGAFALKLRGYVQADTRFYFDDAGDRGIDTFLLRSVRPTLDGTLRGRFDFRISPDFGNGLSTLQDAYVDAKLTPALRVRAGKFTPPVGLERLASSTDLLFVERGLPTSLVPNRDLGVQIFGDPSRGRWSYAVGIFNGVADNIVGDADGNDRKELAARIFLTPWKGTPGILQGLGFGVGASRGDDTGTLTAPGVPVYRTPGQLAAFAYRVDPTNLAGTVLAAGTRERFAPQLTYVHGPFELLAEWTRSGQEVAKGAARAELEHEAWQMAAGWLLTGEPASLRTPSPARPFDPQPLGGAGGWGALELVARVGSLEVDPDAFPVFANPATAVAKIDSWGVGVDWYLNRNLKLQLDYEDAAFDGGSGNGDRPDEKTLFGRFQVSF